MIVRHLKTGNNYVLLDYVDDATNFRNGNTVVLYTRKNLKAKLLLFLINLVGLQLYVRDVEEFREKFRRG